MVHSLLPNRLNEFCLRFDRGNSSHLIPDGTAICNAPLNITVRPDKRKFQQLNEQKASGPDGITKDTEIICRSAYQGLHDYF